MKELRNAKELVKEKAENLAADVAFLSRVIDQERIIYKENLEASGESDEHMVYYSW